MITLDNFENFVPYKILMRGEEYYDLLDERSLTYWHKQNSREHNVKVQS